MFVKPRIGENVLCLSSAAFRNSLARWMDLISFCLTPQRISPSQHGRPDIVQRYRNAHMTPLALTTANKQALSKHYSRTWYRPMFHVKHNQASNHFETSAEIGATLYLEYLLRSLHKIERLSRLSICSLIKLLYASRAPNSFATIN